MVEEYSDEKLEEILDKVYEWGIEFSRSKYFEELTEEQKRESEFVVMSFTELMYSYHGLSPEEWDEDRLEECCLYTLPRKVTADESYFESIAPVLSAFFAFLSEKNLLKNTSKLIRKVKKIDRQIVRNARDPRYWGIAKSFVMAAKDAGVDITNKEEMQKFMVFYNLQQLAKLERDKSKTSKTKSKKVGGNDPTLGEVEKKYKKCCGSVVNTSRRIERKIQSSWGRMPNSSFCCIWSMNLHFYNSSFTTLKHVHVTVFPTPFMLRSLSRMSWPISSMSLPLTLSSKSHSPAII